MRFIGRSVKEVSPQSFAVIPAPTNTPDNRRIAVPELSHSISFVGVCTPFLPVPVITSSSPS